MPNFEFSRDDAPVFVISVAADLTGMHPQTLRGYDRIGLVSPGRTGGGGRRYSWRDIEQLREVGRLTAQGIGLEGVRRILELQNEVDALRARASALESALEVALDALSLPGERANFAAERANLPAVTSSTQAMVRWRHATR